MGENGLINRTIKAKTKTTIAETEEIANLAIIEAYAKDYITGTVEPMTAAVAGLQANGYTVESVSSTELTIDDISLTIDGSAITSLSLNTGETKTIKVSIADSSSTTNYVLIDEEYHQMSYNTTTQKIAIAETGTATKPTGTGASEITITPSENLAGLVTINGNEVVSTPEAITVTPGTELTIVAKDTEVTGATLTVTCGNSKEYAVTIFEVLTVKIASGSMLADGTTATADTTLSSQNINTLAKATSSVDGSIIKVKNEQFYVLDYDVDAKTVTCLAMYCLMDGGTTGTYKQTTSDNTSSAVSSAFSSTNYWYDSANGRNKDEYVNLNYYVYNNQSTLYSIVEAYKKQLGGTSVRL